MADKSSVEITGDYDDLERSLDESASLFDEFGDKVEKTASQSSSSWRAFGDTMRDLAQMVRSVWDSATDLMSRSFDDFWSKIKDGTKAFIDMGAEITRLGQTIRAMGSVVGYALSGLEKMNAALKGVSVNGSDAIRSAQIALLQFRDVRGDVFKEAIKSAMDFSAVMGGSLSSAAEHYGRLLSDPQKALKDMAESGVQFTDSQVKLIRQLEKSKDMMGLQRVVLEKLKEMYGGAATEQANTLSGALQRLDNIFDEIYKKIGSLLAPVLTNKLIPIMEKVAKVVDFLVAKLDDGGEAMGKAFDRAVQVVREWGDKALDIGVEVFSFLRTAVQNWELTWKVAWLKMRIVAAETAVFVIQKMVELGNLISKGWAALMAQLAPFVDLAKAAFKAVADIAMEVWKLIKLGADWLWDNVGKRVLDWVAVTVGAVYFAGTFIKLVWQDIVTVATAAWAVISALPRAFLEGVKAVLNVFAPLWRAVMTLVVEATKDAFDAVSKVIATATMVASRVMSTLPQAFLEGVKAVITVFNPMWRAVMDLVVEATKDAVSLVLRAFEALFSGIGGGADSVFGKIFDYLKALGFDVMTMIGGRVKEAMAPAFAAMNKIGVAFDDAKAKAAAAADDIKNKFNAAFAGMNADKAMKDLRDNAKALGGDFDKAWAEFEKKLQGNLGADAKAMAQWKAKLKKVMDAEDEQAGKGVFAKPLLPAGEGGEFGRIERQGGRGGMIEGLMDLNRRIQGAAARSPEAAATDKQSELMKTLHDARMRQGQQLIDAVNAKKTKIRDDGGMDGIAPPMPRLFQNGRFMGGAPGMGF